MSQIIMIGISGLDADLLRVYEPSLPNLRRLMLESPFLELRSTIPPEPVPAWTSVYTGLNPANHGLLEKMDCLERAVPSAHELQAELFWERAARARKQVCILNPLFAGPNSSIEGLTLSQSLPPSASNQTSPNAPFPALLDEPLIPTASQLAAFCNSLGERTKQQVSVALEWLARKTWDLFFVQLDALDHVQHFLWRYSNPSDPMYPGKNEHANRILDFYRLFDQVVGRFRAAMPAESILAVVSSHGHEQRCTHRLHINEWLREQQFLVPQGRKKARFGRSASAPKQSNHLAFQKKIGLGDLRSWLAQRFPRLGESDNPLHCIDSENSLARLVELACANSSYGGLRLNRELIERKQLDYEQVRESILVGLEQLSAKGRPVVNWARKREQCYEGKFLDRYPDILFELRNDFGADRSIYSPLITPDSTHRLISGAHSARGVFLLENWPPEIDIYEDFLSPSVMDVAPTLLRLLDIECTPLDGHALVRPHVARQLI